jgi:hypothetical protein
VDDHRHRRLHINTTWPSATLHSFCQDAGMRGLTYLLFHFLWFVTGT